MPAAENLRQSAAHCKQGADEADRAVGSIQAIHSRVESILNDLAALRGEIAGLSFDAVVGQVVLAAGFARQGRDELPPGELAGRADALATKIETADDAVSGLAGTNLTTAEAALTELRDTTLLGAGQGYAQASGILDECEREAISIADG